MLSLAFANRCFVFPAPGKLHSFTEWVQRIVRYGGMSESHPLPQKLASRWRRIDRLRLETNPPQAPYRLIPHGCRWLESAVRFTFELASRRRCAGVTPREPRPPLLSALSFRSPWRIPLRLVTFQVPPASHSPFSLVEGGKTYTESRRLRCPALKSSRKRHTPLLSLTQSTNPEHRAHC